NNSHIKTISKDTESLRKEFESVKVLDRFLDDMKMNLEKGEANARKIERLSGQVDALSKQVEALARTKVVYVPRGGTPGRTPDVPEEPEEGTAETPNFEEEETPGKETEGEREEETKEVETPKEEESAVESEEVKAFRRWKAKLIGRKLKAGEMKRLWKPDEAGVIRPVVPGDETWFDNRKTGGRINRRLGTDPKGFNPLTENSADVSDIYAYCLGFLCQRRPKDPDVWEGDLATDVEISEDYKVYTFTLRKGVKWQLPAVDLNDPQYGWLASVDREVTAEDYKFKVDMIKNPQVQCEHSRLYYQELDRVEVLGRYKFRMVWSKKTYNSLSASMGMAPLPRFLYANDESGESFPAETLGKEFNEHWYNNMILGCYMYNFVEWREGQYVKRTKNPEYYGAPAHIDEIVFHIIRDNEAAFLKLKSKNPEDRLDFSGLTRTQYKKHYREPLADGKIPEFYQLGDDPKPGQDKVIDFYTRLGYYYVGWNLEKPKFKDKRVRRALTHAFPRQLVLDSIFEGLGTIVSGNFYLYGPDYSHKIRPYPYDLDEARRLLGEAGWADLDGNGILEKEMEGKVEEFRFSLYIYANSDAYRDMGNIYKEHLRKVGVILDVTPLDWSLMQQKMENREFDCYTGGWALSWVSDPYQIWHSKMADTPKSSNFVSFRNEECDRIIDTARETFAPKERQKLFHRFHEIVHEEQPYTFLFCIKSIPAWWPHVNPEFYPNRPQAFGGRWFLTPR
ncbi:MAG: ABC transporter substrate-binding protein, partial [Planctomycetota bacterium]